MLRITSLTALAALAPTGLTAQGVDLASQTLGRAYWHVFAAYAVVWILVLWWAYSISKRLSEVERKLEE